MTTRSLNLSKGVSVHDRILEKFKLWALRSWTFVRVNDSARRQHLIRNRPSAVKCIVNSFEFFDEPSTAVLFTAGTPVKSPLIGPREIGKQSITPFTSDFSSGARWTPTLVAARDTTFSCSCLINRDFSVRLTRITDRIRRRERHQLHSRYEIPPLTFYFLWSFYAGKTSFMACVLQPVCYIDQSTPKLRIRS